MPPEFVLPHNVAPFVPRIDAYFGIWSMHEPTFVQLVDYHNGLNLKAHAVSPEALQAIEQQNESPYLVDQNGIATIPIRGPMMKQASSLTGGTSTVRVRQQLRAALNDPEVLGAVLLMETPGGTVSGNADLANEVAQFAKSKPIYAFVEDMTASAGVSVASQATKRFANSPDALYGSMGTYTVLVDRSKQAEQLGVKVHVIRAGQHKGSGTPGTEITAEQLAEAQRVIDATNEQYISLIARGLGMPTDKVQSLADGRVHTAQSAVSMGLIDGIQSYDETVRQLVADVAGRRTLAKRGKPMSESTNPATLADLKKSFPRSSAEWRESQIEAGATLVQAGIAYAAHLEEQLAKSSEQIATLEKAKQEAEPTAPAKKVGNSPIVLRQGEEADVDGDMAQSFDELVRRYQGNKTGLDARFAALAKVHRLHPQLYATYVTACNQSPDPAIKRLMSEKAYRLAQPVKN